MEAIWGYLMQSTRMTMLEFIFWCLFSTAVSHLTNAVVSYIRAARDRRARRPRVADGWLR